MTGPTHPPAAPEDAVLLDSSALEGLRRLEQDVGPGLLAELIDIYLADAPQRIAALVAAAAAGDAGTLAGQSHALRSSCAQLGARSMAVLCRRIEDQARAGTLSDGVALTAQLSRLFDRLRPALAAERDAGN